MKGLKEIRYNLEMTSTESATGYFSCRPNPELTMDEILEVLKMAPNDDFMHKHLLKHLAGLKKDSLKKLIRETSDMGDKKLLAALYEVALTVFKTPDLLGEFKNTDPSSLIEFSPLTHIKSHLVDKSDSRLPWADLFKKNILSHIPLPALEQTGLPPLYEEAGPAGDEAAGAIRSIEEIFTDHKNQGKYPQPPATPLGETIDRALEKLKAVNILNGEEMRHESSLSPFALLRKWDMRIAVKNRRHNYTLSGIQTSYGKGLSLEAARASNLMEIVERYSSFAGFDGGIISGLKIKQEVIRARFSELSDRGVNALDPGLLSIDAPYMDEPLYWMKARTIRDQILIPVQAVFLFCNLDEISLFGGLGSTGLASGNTMEGAKFSALLEVVERDCEAVMPFSKNLCFRAVSHIPEIEQLLKAYWERGIQIQFQDITSDLGIPCCKCFVTGEDGVIAKGTGAHLSAKKALLSAMTETTYPFPLGPPSAPADNGLTFVPVENLPDYSTGNPVTDLAILEEILTSRGYNPIYVDLTRGDMEIPVVRAIVPGLELSADFDVPSPRLFRNYLNLFKEV